MRTHPLGTSRPRDVPSNPDSAYDEWAGWGDWLGYSGLAYAPRKSRMLPFEAARETAWALGLSSQVGEAPVFSLYPGLGYLSWRKYGPNNPCSCTPRTPRSQREWEKWSGSGDRPVNMPARPDRTYKAAGWLSWADWLG